MKSVQIEEEKCRHVDLGEFDPTKKVLFLELDKTIVYITNEMLDGIPYHVYVDEDMSTTFGMDPFFIYL